MLKQRRHKVLVHYTNDTTTKHEYGTGAAARKQYDHYRQRTDVTEVEMHIAASRCGWRFLYSTTKPQGWFDV